MKRRLKQWAIPICLLVFLLGLTVAGETRSRTRYERVVIRLAPIAERQVALISQGGRLDVSVGYDWKVFADRNIAIGSPPRRSGGGRHFFYDSGPADHIYFASVGNRVFGRGFQVSYRALLVIEIAMAAAIFFLVEGKRRGGRLWRRSRKPGRGASRRTRKKAPQSRARKRAKPHS